MSDRSFAVDVHDPAAADRARRRVQLGRRFVFLSEGGAQAPGRLGRLLGRSGSPTGRVQPLIDQPVALEGFTIQPAPVEIEPVCALITDRDLYRAEQDTVHVLLAMPAPVEGMRLVVEQSGQVLTERSLDLAEYAALRDHGMHIEPLAMLLPGDYSVQLAVGDRRVGRAATFTVAEYVLAPLSGRLITHALDRASGQIAFALEVDSYQRPYDRPLRVELVEAGRAMASVDLDPIAPGRYEGALPIGGEGLLRLRLASIDDAARVCEVVVPGSRKRERDATVVSELGAERLISLMPEPDALPLRGAYLSEGDFLSTPVVVDEVVAEVGVLSIRAEIGALTTVALDLCTGEWTTVHHGDVRAGTTVQVDVPSCAVAVFVGGWVAGRPFEGFTHFLRPATLGLEVTAAHDPKERVLTVRIKDDRGAGPVPVLLSVRDERLTQADTPEVALSGSLKRCIEGATAAYGEDEGVRSLGDDALWASLGGARRVRRQRVRDLLGEITRGGREESEDFDEDDETVDLFYDDSTDGFEVDALSLAADDEDERTMVLSAEPSGTSFWSRDALSEISSEGDVGEEEDEEPLGEENAASAFDKTIVLSASRRVESRRGRSDPGARQVGAGEVDEIVDGAGMDRAGEGSAAEAAPSEAAAPRSVVPEVLFYGLVTVDGEVHVDLPLADSLGTFTVEAFAVSRRDWARQQRTVVVDQPVRADLVLPPAIHPGDAVAGTVRAAARSGRVRLSLTRDGDPVALRDRAGRPIDPARAYDSPLEARFDAAPGAYVAAVTDADTGETDGLERIVSAPGQLRSLARELGLLCVGDRLDLAAAGDEVLSLRVLPGLDEPMGALVRETAGYAHLCCEQTAAKVLSAAVMYLSADGEADRRRAEEIIVAGVARERSMHLPGRGFRMYPGSHGVCDYYSPLAARYLWKLHQLGEVPSLSPALRAAVAEGLQMAYDAGRAHGLQRVPDAIADAEGAYTVATSCPDRVDEAVRWTNDALDLDGPAPRMRRARGAVAQRASLAYAAATLIAAGDLARGLRVANVVTRQFNAGGALYSTVDSVAAIALMVQLQRAGVVGRGGTVIANGQRMSTAEASALSDQVESIEVVEGTCLVQLTAIRTERWDAYAGAFGVRVGFRDGEGGAKKRFAPGDRADLLVELLDGYTDGDLVHVCLPAALSWLKGGGMVQQFTVDFEGERSVRVPVLATGEIADRQRFAVCVRNMFEEERASNPGLLEIRGG